MNSVFRMEAKNQIVEDSADEDLVGKARSEMDRRKRDAWKTTPPRRDRERGIQRSNPSSATPESPHASQNNVSTDPRRPENFNASATNAAARANDGDAEAARKAMDARKRDAWRQPRRAR